MQMRVIHSMQVRTYYIYVQVLIVSGDGNIAQSRLVEYSATAQRPIYGQTSSIHSNVHNIRLLRVERTIPCTRMQ